MKTEGEYPNLEISAKFSFGSQSIMSDLTHIDALDYAKDVATRLEAVSMMEYFLRDNRNTKWLIEEEWPLACLGKILYHPDRRTKSGGQR